MNIHKRTALALAAGAALLTLAGCGGQDTATADAPNWPPITTETTPAPVPDAPRIDLPDLGDDLDMQQIGEDAFVDTVDDEGIAYPSRAALLATADRACAEVDAGGDLFTVIAVFETDGYGADAAYMAGAALAMCALGGER